MEFLENSPYPIQMFPAGLDFGHFNKAKVSRMIYQGTCLENYSVTFRSKTCREIFDENDNQKYMEIFSLFDLFIF